MSQSAKNWLGDSPAIGQFGAITVCTLPLHESCESGRQLSCYLGHSFESRKTGSQPAPLPLEAVRLWDEPLCHGGSCGR